MAHLRRLATIIAAGALTGALVLPAAPEALAAGPGSIVFIRKGNVWLTRPDGSAQRKLTRGGGWSSPSQSSKGLIVAQRRRRLVRLTRTGRWLRGPMPSRQ